MTTCEVGYRAGIAAFMATVSYDVVQILQVAGLLHFPLDEILIYGTSLCIVVPFVLVMVALHEVTVRVKQVWTLGALVFVGMYAVFATANYVVQLATVLPAKMSGSRASDVVRLLDQTPHSMFWDYDAVAYMAMGVATALAVPALGRAGIEKWVRRSLLAHALATPLIACVYFYPVYSTRLLILGFPWGITAPLFMLSIALMLRRGMGLDSSH